MTDRPYFDHEIDQLEQLVLQNRDRAVILGQIRTELEYRTTARAKQLLKEVLALVEGKIPKPPPPPADRATDQRSML